MDTEKLTFFVQGMLQMFFIFATILLFKKSDKTRTQQFLMYGMLYWAILVFKDLFLRHDHAVLSPCIIFPDLIVVPLSSFYFLEYLFPGKMTLKKCIRFLLPYFIIIAAYCIALIFSPYKAHYSFATTWADCFRLETALRIIFAVYAIIFSIVIGVKLLIQSKKYKQFIDQNFSYKENIHAEWISPLIFIMVFILSVYLSIYAFGNPSAFADLIYYLFQMFIWCFILIKIINFQPPELIVNYWQKNSNMHLASGNAVIGAKTKYSSKQIAGKIKTAFAEKQLHLNPKLTIVDLANECNTNRTYLSEYLNKELNSSFYDYVNSYRIEHTAIPLLKNQSRKMSLEDIAFQSGFGSVSTFRRAFQKFSPKSIHEVRKHT